VLLRYVSDRIAPVPNSFKPTERLDFLATNPSWDIVPHAFLVCDCPELLTMNADFQILHPRNYLQFSVNTSTYTILAHMAQKLQKSIYHAIHSRSK
jgi:hypothetical protein